MRTLRGCAVACALLSGLCPLAAQETKPSDSGTPSSGGHLVLERKNRTDTFGEVYALAFSPDSKVLASGHKDRTVLLWDVPTGKEIIALKGHTGPVHAVAFAPDGSLLASGSDDGTIRLWAWGPADADPPRGKLLATLEGHRMPVRSVAFSPDGKALASGGSGTQGGVKVWDVAGRKERLNLKTVVQWSAFGTVPVSLGTVVGAVTFSRDGKQLGAVCGHSAKVWDAASGRESVTIGPFGPWTALAPEYMMLGGRRYENFIAGSAAFTPDGRSLITTWCNQSQNMPGPDVGYHVGAQAPGLGWKGPLDCSPLKMWNLGTRQGRSPIQFRQHEVVYVDRVLRQPRRVGVGSEGVLCFAYSADGKMIVTGGSELPLTGKETRLEELLTRFEKNPDDRQPNVVKLWETTKGQSLAVLKGHKGHIRAVAIAPSGAWAASGSFDIRLWDVGRAVADKAGK